MPMTIIRKQLFLKGKDDESSIEKHAVKLELELERACISVTISIAKSKGIRIQEEKHCVVLLGINSQVSEELPRVRWLFTSQHPNAPYPQPSSFSCSLYIFITIYVYL